MVVEDSLLLQHKRKWLRDAKVDVDFEQGLASLQELAEYGPFGDPTYRIRMQRYVEREPPQAKESNSRLVNLMQSADYMGVPSKLAPRLLKASYLYDLVSHRELIAAQHLLIQGFPVRGLVDPSESRFFPFPAIVKLEVEGEGEDSIALKDKEIRVVAGLSFHWACLGALLMFSWALSELVDDDDDA